MRSLRNSLIIAATAVMLISCSTTTDTVAAVESGYITSLGAYDVYLKSGKADKSAVAEIEKARAVVAAAIDPIADATGKGNPPTSNQVAALQAAFAAFQAALLKYNIH